jgi:hypothetical protein
VKSIRAFLDQVESQARLLAKHNIPAEVGVLGSRFGPSREQVHLATVIALDHAFYRVREAYAQARFGLYRAGGGGARCRRSAP